MTYLQKIADKWLCFFKWNFLAKFRKPSTKRKICESLNPQYQKTCLFWTSSMTCLHGNRCQTTRIDGFQSRTLIQDQSDLSRMIAWFCSSFSYWHLTTKHLCIFQIVHSSVCFSKFKSMFVVLSCWQTKVPIRNCFRVACCRHPN